MTINERLEKGGITIPLPTDEDFWRLDIGRIKEPLLIYAFLQAIYENTGHGVDSHSDMVPVAVPVSVTDAETVLATVSLKPRKIGVFNNGASDIVILEGSSHPGFLGQDNGSGVLGADFGIILRPTDYFESPVAHKGPIRARARDTETTTVTVTGY
jgi:hypothetical protein